MISNTGISPAPNPLRKSVENLEKEAELNKNNGVNLGSTNLILASTAMPDQNEQIQPGVKII